MLQTVLLVVLLVAKFTWAAPEGYSEHLTVKPLPRNALLTSFHFESYSGAVPQESFFLHEEKFSPKSYAQYELFPRTLGQMIEQSRTRELHLRFSQGWWDAWEWGTQPGNGSHSGGIGVELWAKVQGDSLESAQANWKRLVNILSGFFCASLNFIDSAHTTLPVRSFGSTAEQGQDGVYLMHGALPSEPVCTENLTPFVKLLPCKGKTGISSLLDGHKIFDSQWQSMSIDVAPVCYDDGFCRWKMTLTIEAVIDVPRALGRQKSPVPTPVPEDELRCDTSKPYYNKYQCLPLREALGGEWKISALFGRHLRGSCPLASNDIHVSVESPSSWKTLLATADRKMGEEGLDDADDGIEMYSLHEGSQFRLDKDVKTDLILQHEDSGNSGNDAAPDEAAVPIQVPAVYVERSFTGRGDHGGIRTVFTNPSADNDVRFVYFETLPWFMRVYIHTLRVDTLYEGDSASSIGAKDIVHDIFYSSAKDRERPTQVEFELVVPKNTSIALSYDFDKSLLYLSEYPPDANHGFSIAPGILTVLDDSSNANGINGAEVAPFTIRTTSLLLPLPTPDFSMPYNVIILTCTLMAFAFGTLFNLLTKQIVTEQEAEALSKEKPLGKLKASIERLKAKLEPKKIDRRPFPYEPDQPDNSSKSK